MDDILPQDTSQKQCSKCENLFPATSDFFQRNRQAKDGFRPDCKVCRKAYNARPDVKQQKLAYNHTYYRENHDSIRAQAKRSYHSNPEVREKALDYNKRPDVRAYQRTYLKEYNRRPDIRERDREAKQIAKRNRRAHEKAIAGSYTKAQIQDLLKRQKHRCYYCNKEFDKRNSKYIYHVDHTFPLSRVVGTDIPANDISYLILACPSCNQKKHDKFPWEFPEGGKLL